MKTIAKGMLIGVLVLLIGVSFWACNLGLGSDSSVETGILSLSLTDAPIDASNVSGVWITITGIEYQLGQDGNDAWVAMSDFEGPQKYNLLELSNGNSTLLGQLSLPAGQINQIRFMLDIPAWGSTGISNPGCYIAYNDGTADEPLFVPSGGQTGYKAVGSFQVPSNGTIELTADFDVRKAVVVAGQSGLYILKPTIRLIADNEAGKITGSVIGYTGTNDLIVFAYEDGTYDSAVETADPADGEARFPNAVTSIAVDDSAGFALWYLAAGTYDLVVAEYNGDTFLEAQELQSDIVVSSGPTTGSVSIDASVLN